MGPLATAAVEIIGDYSEFDKDFDGRMRSSARKAGKALDDGITKATRNTGRKAGQAIGDGLWRDVNGRLRDVRGRFAKAGQESGQAFGKSFGDTFRRVFEISLSRVALRALFAPLIGILGTIGFATAAAGAAQLAAAMVSLTAALAPAAGALAGLPAVILGGAAAIGTLRVALAGVGDAFEAALGDDAKKFEESLKGLSPAARDVAKELRSLKPALDRVKNAVQDVFFGPLRGQLEALGRALAGPMQRGMTGVAQAMGNAAREAVAFGRSAATVRAVGVIFTSVRDAINTLRPAIEPALAGFRDLAVAVAPMFQQMAEWITTAAVAFGHWASNAARSGQAVRWVEDAVDVFRQMWNITRNLASSIASLLRAAETAGGGLLGTFERLTGQFAAFLRSAEGQQRLVTIFRSLQQVGAALSPVIVTLVNAVGQLAPSFAAIAKAAGPALVAAIQGIVDAVAEAGPGLTALTSGLAQGLQAFQPALGPLGAALGQVLKAISPLLPVVGQLAGVLGGVLADALRAIAVVAKPVVDALAGALGPILPRLASAFSQLAEAAMPLAETLGQQLGAALAELLPLVLELAPVLITSLIPAMVELTRAVTPLIPPLVQLAVAALRPILEVLPQLIPPLGQLLTAMVQLTTTVAPFAAALARVAAGFVSWGSARIVVPLLQGISTAIQFAIGVLSRFLTVVSGVGGVLLYNLAGGFRSAAEAVSSAVPQIAAWVTSLPGRLSAGLTGAGTRTRTAFSNMWNQALRTTTSIGGRIVSWVSGLPGRIGGALGRLGGAIGGAFSRAWATARVVLAAAMASVVATVAGLPGRVAGALSGLGGALIRAFSRAFDRVIGFVRDQVQRIRDIISGALGYVQDKLNSIRGLMSRLPGLAGGGIVRRPMVARLGEGSRPEVVIPLTKPARAVQLAYASGLMDLLARQRALPTTYQPAVVAGAVAPVVVRTRERVVHAPITVHTTADPEGVAVRVSARVARLAEG